MAFHKAVILMSALLVISSLQKRINLQKAKEVRSHGKQAPQEVRSHGKQTPPENEAAYSAFAALEKAREQPYEAQAALKLADAADVLAGVSPPEQHVEVRKLAKAAEALARDPFDPAKREAVYAAAVASGVAPDAEVPEEDQPKPKGILEKLAKKATQFVKKVAKAQKTWYGEEQVKAEALQEEIPGWTVHWDEATEAPFYENIETQVAYWEHPDVRESREEAEAVAGNAGATEQETADKEAIAENAEATGQQLADDAPPKDDKGAGKKEKPRKLKASAFRTSPLFALLGTTAIAL